VDRGIMKLGQKKRIAVVWNIPVACNRASADFMISSTLMTGEYDRLITDYTTYRERQVVSFVGAKAEDLVSASEAGAPETEAPVGAEAEELVSAPEAGAPETESPEATAPVA
jgi:hypothetical protein